MALIYTPQPIPASEFARVFAEERVREYPAIDAFEDRFGYAVDRARLEEAARVLCCPCKAAAPNWQHGRVLYTLARHVFATATAPVTCLDIGTAKGFSALCVQWALLDAQRDGSVTSVDVMPPEARVRRGTIVEVDRLLTLREILAPWPESQSITFVASTGIDWLKRHPGRIHFAFIDGKHTFEVVEHEGRLLAARQEPGDLAVFDDVQMTGVGVAVRQLGTRYAVEYLAAKAERVYAIGVKR